MSAKNDFWSRRRAGVEAEQIAFAADEAKTEPVPVEEKTDEEILSELSLPDPDALVKGDDFSAFMAKAVPEHLRRRALRTLWRSNPALANLDMLVDYGEDFTDSALNAGTVQTAYQVGKGMLKHIEKMAQDAEALSEAGETTPEPDALIPEQEAETPISEAVEDPAGEEGRAFELEINAENVDQEEDTALRTPMPRRMKFRAEVTA